eukprot:TRINITY_DN2209_c0_g2_i2.p1 TRINITY_DN2209_c0_g2~~TRINITY_DN2209_c0_g2_i2.p1  ORF type:complete len:694 (-),score=121.26 TRINITY_DN2209_c0_g2_i2:105-2186(-)
MSFFVVMYDTDILLALLITILLPILKITWDCFFPSPPNRSFIRTVRTVGGKRFSVVRRIRYTPVRKVKGKRLLKKKVAQLSQKCTASLNAIREQYNTDLAAIKERYKQKLREKRATKTKINKLTSAIDGLKRTYEFNLVCLKSKYAHLQEAAKSALQSQKDARTALRQQKAREISGLKKHYESQLVEMTEQYERIFQQSQAAHESQVQRLTHALDKLDYKWNVWADAWVASEEEKSREFSNLKEQFAIQMHHTYQLESLLKDTKHKLDVMKAKYDAAEKAHLQQANDQHDIKLVQTAKYEQTLQESEASHMEIERLNSMLDDVRTALQLERAARIALEQQKDREICELKARLQDTESNLNEMKNQCAKKTEDYEELKKENKKLAVACKEIQDFSIKETAVKMIFETQNKNLQAELNCAIANLDDELKAKEDLIRDKATIIERLKSSFQTQADSNKELRISLQVFQSNFDDLQAQYDQQKKEFNALKLEQQLAQKQKTDLENRLASITSDLDMKVAELDRLRILAKRSADSEVKNFSGVNQQTKFRAQYTENMGLRKQYEQPRAVPRLERIDSEFKNEIRGRNANETHSRDMHKDSHCNFAITVDYDSNGSERKVVRTTSPVNASHTAQSSEEKAPQRHQNANPREFRPTIPRMSERNSQSQRHIDNKREENAYPHKQHPEGFQRGSHYRKTGQ